MSGDEKLSAIAIVAIAVTVIGLGVLGASCQAMPGSQCASACGEGRYVRVCDVQGYRVTHIECAKVQ